MARRVHMIAGRGDSYQFGKLLGLDQYRDAVGLVREVWRAPLIDFDDIEKQSGHELPEIAREKIQHGFDDLLTFELARLLPEMSDDAQGAFGQFSSEMMSNLEFKKLVAKVSTRAARLRDALDELLEFDTDLCLPPRDTRLHDEGSSGLRSKIDEIVSGLPPVFRPSKDDFEDYVIFRKFVDYLEHFEQKNEPYNNWYGARWTDETDHNLFELFVRRAVIALRNSGFPMSLTVPTDTAPDYQSPCVAVLLPLQDAWNHVLQPSIEENQYEQQSKNYRQMLYLVDKILKSIQSLEDAFAMVRRSYR